MNKLDYKEPSYQLIQIQMFTIIPLSVWGIIMIIAVHTVLASYRWIKQINKEILPKTLNWSSVIISIGLGVYTSSRWIENKAYEGYKNTKYLFKEVIFRNILGISIIVTYGCTKWFYSRTNQRTHKEDTTQQQSLWHSNYSIQKSVANVDVVDL